MDRENARQLFHMTIGVGALALLLLLGRGFMIAAIFCILIVGTLLINLRLRGFRISMVQWFEERFERDNVPMPGWGSACYAAGTLLTITFLSDISQMAAAMFLLGIGDAISTIVGRMGKIKLPYNSNKTLEGSLAFFIVSLPVWYFIGPLAIPLALAGALAESIPGLDDNLSIPIACVIFFRLVG